MSINTTRFGNYGANTNLSATSNNAGVLKRSAEATLPNGNDAVGRAKPVTKSDAGVVATGTATADKGTLNYTRQRPTPPLQQEKPIKTAARNTLPIDLTTFEEKKRPVSIQPIKVGPGQNPVDKPDILSPIPPVDSIATTSPVSPIRLDDGSTDIQPIKAGPGEVRTGRPIILVAKDPVATTDPVKPIRYDNGGVVFQPLKPIAEPLPYTPSPTSKVSRTLPIIDTSLPAPTKPELAIQAKVPEDSFPIDFAPVDELV